MPDYSTPFTSGFSAGASAGHMRAMQVERMMELRAQEAQRAVQERMLNAQAAMLTQHAKYYEQQALMEQQQRIKDDALNRAIGDTYDQNLKQTGDPDQAFLATIPIAGRVDPKKAEQLSLVWENLQRAKSLGKPKPLTPEEAAAKGAETQMYRAHADLYRAQALAEPKDNSSPALKEAQDLAKVKGELDALIEQSRNLPELDPAIEAKRKNLQTIVDSMEARHGQEEISVSTPGGPEVRIVKGGKKEAGALSPTETTKYGEDVMATENSLRVLNRLRGQLGSGVVGAVPMVENLIFDEVLPQFGIDTADAKRIRGRQNIRLGTQSVLGELNTRGRISNQELNAIKAAMPSLGMAENDPNAKINLDELRLMLAEKGAAAAVAIRRPVGNATLQALSELFPPGKAGEQAMAAEVRGGSLNANVALQVRKWQKQKGL